MISFFIIIQIFLYFKVVLIKVALFLLSSIVLSLSFIIFVLLLILFYFTFGPKAQGQPNCLKTPMHAHVIKQLAHHPFPWLLFLFCWHTAHTLFNTPPTCMKKLQPAITHPFSHQSSPPIVTPTPPTAITCPFTHD